MKISEIVGEGNKLWDEKISKISKRDKNYIVLKYFNRQLLDSKKKFMKWYIGDQDTKLRYGQIHSFSRKYYSYIKMIPIFTKIVKVHDKFLDRDINKYKFAWLEKKTKRKRVVDMHQNSDDDGNDESNVFVS